MNHYWKIIILAGSLLMACTHNATIDKAETLGQPQPELWFKGNPEQAFAKAEADKKLVFLYWGAIWCPPCNELKAQIFSQARFAELMQNFVPVYLDGDSEDAQIWGERLQASGYPTVLILTSDRKEVFRLSSSISIDEFSEAVSSLMTESQNFEKAVQNIEAEKGSPRDFQVLAYASWDSLPESPWTEARKSAVLGKAAKACPASLKKERALLSAAYLGMLSGEKTPRVLTDKELEFAFQAIFLDESTVWSARSFVNYSAESLLPWLAWKSNSKAYQQLKTQWLAAAALIEAHPQASVDTRLWTVNPELAFFRYEHPKEKVGPDLKIKVEKAAAKADTNATSEFDRHAAISGAAYLLRKVDSHAEARRLLEEEVKRTNTPWYYYGSLSALESELKNTAAAQKWSALARETVQGRASKIQWITSDLVLNAKDKTRKDYVLSISREFYAEALQNKDGFAGRNHARAKKVQEALQAWKADADFSQAFTEYRKRCAQQNPESKGHCQSHFASLL